MEWSSLSRSSLVWCDTMNGESIFEVDCASHAAVFDTVLRVLPWILLSCVPSKSLVVVAFHA